MADDASAFERHYRIGELARMWSIGRETLRKILASEPGVVKIRLGGKQKNTTYSVDRKSVV